MVYHIRLSRDGQPGAAGYARLHEATRSQSCLICDGPARFSGSAARGAKKPTIAGRDRANARRFYTSLRAASRRRPAR